MKKTFDTTLLCLGLIWLCQTSLDLSAAENADKVRPVVAPSFQRLREQNVRRLDSKASLDLLVKTLKGTKDEGIQAALLRGMLSGMAGRRNVAEPKDWQEAKAGLSKGSCGGESKYDGQDCQADHLCRAVLLVHNRMRNAHGRWRGGCT